MLYSDSLREMMQNGLNESFWDGLGVEIGACAIFHKKWPFPKKLRFPIFYEIRKAWVGIPTPRLISNNLSDLVGGGFWYTFGCSWRAIGAPRAAKSISKIGFGTREIRFLTPKILLGRGKFYF